MSGSLRKAAAAVGAAVLFAAGTPGGIVRPLEAAAAPITSEQSMLLGNNTSAGDSLGFSVSISGDTAVVGAPLDNTAAGENAGSVYVFTRSATTWTQQAQLFASDAAAGDEFGHSVAIAGNTIVVGAHLDNTPADGETGSAYVFVRSGTTWTQQQHLFASDPEAFDQFGESVGIFGDTIVVGAHLDDTGAGDDAGSVSVFTRSGTTWSEQDQLFASDDNEGDGFGASVSIHENTVVVGAPLDDTGAGTEAGSAYVFTRSVSTWSQQDHLFAVDDNAGDQFGSSVAVFGDTAVIGAEADDTAAGGAAGSAYVFTRASGNWSEQQHLFGVNASTNDHFGHSVAMWGATIVVGAYRDNTAAGTDAGSVYVFTRPDTTWGFKSQLFASDAAEFDQFGVSVAVSGNTALAGADLNDTEAGSDAGAGYVFTPGYPQDSWETLGGKITGRPDVVQLADGTLFYFGVGTDSAVWVHEIDPDGNSLGWSTLGGVAKGGLGASNAIAANADPDTGRVDVFVRGNDDAVWYRTYNAGDPSPAWSPWDTLEGVATSEPTAMAFGDPDDTSAGSDLVIEVFVRGTDNALWRRTFFGGSGGGWTPWTSLGGLLRSAPGAGGNPTAFVGNVAVRGNNNAVWYRDYDATTATFGPWLSAGGVVNAEPEGEYLCTPTFFARGTDNAIWTTSINPDTGWRALAGNARSGPGTHEMVFSEVDPSPEWIAAVRGSDDGLWYRRHRWVPDTEHCLPGGGDEPNHKPPLG